eukprot:jgi/Mesvir1/23692/Mv18645-RA.1
MASSSTETTDHCHDGKPPIREEEHIRPVASEPMWEIAAPSQGHQSVTPVPNPNSAGSTNPESFGDATKTNLPVGSQDAGASKRALRPAFLIAEPCVPDDIFVGSPVLKELRQRVEVLIAHLLPTPLSEGRRKAVGQFIQRLVHECFSPETRVFAFGSVPLKTYLPDGDIDLTAFSNARDFRERWASELRTVLEAEERRSDAEFRVKDIQTINAEVKLIKCLVENIVVDISANQLGGLCTLCFLEQVDRLVGKQHLFKRSIILVKSWCYYESRLLGAHHGLISTYALEVLVLYIFQAFHEVLVSPIQVLLKFLDYFSCFDWDHYCLTIRGPIPLSKVPDFAYAEPPRTCASYKPLLSEEVGGGPSSGFPSHKSFLTKNMNVLDPMLPTNNLGRSVSKGNLHRIRMALAHGVKKLVRVFQGRPEDAAAGLDRFFCNTWLRHGGSNPGGAAAASSQAYMAAAAAAHYAAAAGASPFPALSPNLPVGGASSAPLLAGHIYNTPVADAGTSHAAAAAAGRVGSAGYPLAMDAYVQESQEAMVTYAGGHPGAGYGVPGVTARGDDKEGVVLSATGLPMVGHSSQPPGFEGLATITATCMPQGPVPGDGMPRPGDAARGVQPAGAWGSRNFTGGAWGSSSASGAAPSGVAGSAEVVEEGGPGAWGTSVRAWGGRPQEMIQQQLHREEGACLVAAATAFAAGRLHAAGTMAAATAAAAAAHPPPTVSPSSQPAAVTEGISPAALSLAPPSSTSAADINDPASGHSHLQPGPLMPWVAEPTALPPGTLAGAPREGLGASLVALSHGALPPVLPPPPPVLLVPAPALPSVTGPPLAGAPAVPLALSPSGQVAASHLLFTTPAGVAHGSAPPLVPASALLWPPPAVPMTTQPMVSSSSSAAGIGSVAEPCVDAPPHGDVLDASVASAHAPWGPALAFTSTSGAVDYHQDLATTATYHHPEWATTSTKRHGHGDAATTSRGVAASGPSASHAHGAEASGADGAESCTSAGRDLPAGAEAAATAGCTPGSQGPLSHEPGSEAAVEAALADATSMLPCMRIHAGVSLDDRGGQPGGKPGVQLVLMGGAGEASGDRGAGGVMVPQLAGGGSGDQQLHGDPTQPSESFGLVEGASLVEARAVGAGDGGVADERSHGVAAAAEGTVAGLAARGDAGPDGVAPDGGLPGVLPRSAGGADTGPVPSAVTGIGYAEGASVSTEAERRPLPSLLDINAATCGREDGAPESAHVAARGGHITGHVAAMGGAGAGMGPTGMAGSMDTVGSASGPVDGPARGAGSDGAAKGAGSDGAAPTGLRAPAAAVAATGAVAIHRPAQSPPMPVTCASIPTPPPLPCAPPLSSSSSSSASSDVPMPWLSQRGRVRWRDHAEDDDEEGEGEGEDDKEDAGKGEGDAGVRGDSHDSKGHKGGGGAAMGRGRGEGMGAPDALGVGRDIGEGGVLSPPPPGLPGLLQGYAADAAMDPWIRLQVQAQLQEWQGLPPMNTQAGEAATSLTSPSPRYLDSPGAAMAAVAAAKATAMLGQTAARNAGGNAMPSQALPLPGSSTWPAGPLQRGMQPGGVPIASLGGMTGGGLTNAGAGGGHSGPPMGVGTALSPKSLPSGVALPTSSHLVLPGAHPGMPPPPPHRQAATRGNPEAAAAAAAFLASGSWPLPGAPATPEFPVQISAFPPVWGPYAVPPHLGQPLGGAPAVPLHAGNVVTPALVGAGHVSRVGGGNPALVGAASAPAGMDALPAELRAQGVPSAALLAPHNGMLPPMLHANAPPGRFPAQLLPYTPLVGAAGAPPAPMAVQGGPSSLMAPHEYMGESAADLTARLSRVMGHMSALNAHTPSFYTGMLQGQGAHGFPGGGSYPANHLLWAELGGAAAVAAGASLGPAEGGSGTLEEPDVLLGDFHELQANLEQGRYLACSTAAG